jgi:hypothetical protein
MLTNYKCPGCGSQRAIYYLLNFDLISAFRINALFVLTIPYVILGLILEYSNVFARSKYHLLLKDNFYGEKAGYFWLLIIIGFWLFRNV